MAGKKRDDDELGKIRLVLEDMRAQNELTAEAVETLGRQNTAELHSLEERLVGRLDVVEAMARSHSTELRTLNAGQLSLTADVRKLDAKVDKLVSLDARMTVLERRSS